jgi:Zn-dependent peptidase ImmA (M78 family)
VAATADPAHRAAAVLAEFERVYHYDGALPVPVDEIAENMARLLVTEVDFATVAHVPEGKKLSGMLLCEPVNRIFVNEVEARRSPGRRRFTVAHELGHWYLHANPSCDTQFERFCRPADLRTDTHVEGQANAFAAALLMPRTLLEEQAAASRYNVPLLAKRFDVSAPAMRLRLLTEDLLPAWMR